MSGHGGQVSQILSLYLGAKKGVYPMHLFMLNRTVVTTPTKGISKFRPVIFVVFLSKAYRLHFWYVYSRDQFTQHIVRFYENTKKEWIYKP